MKSEGLHGFSCLLSFSVSVRQAPSSRLPVVCWIDIRIDIRHSTPLFRLSAADLPRRVEWVASGGGIAGEVGERWGRRPATVVFLLRFGWNCGGVSSEPTFGGRRLVQAPWESRSIEGFFFPDRDAT